MTVPARSAAAVPAPAIGDWLLLSGWGFSPEVFSPLRATLPPGLRVRAAPVTGASAALEAIAAEAAGPFGLCAWSLGATVALDWAARHPGACGALVLAAATPRFVAAADWPWAMSAADFDAFAQTARRSMPEAQLRLVTLSAQGEAAQVPQVRRRLRAALAARPDPADPAAGDFDAALERGLDLLGSADLRPLLASIQAPVIVLHGGGDALVPLQAARELARALPDARLVEVAGAGHAFFVLRTSLLVDAIIAASRGRPLSSRPSARPVSDSPP